MIQNVGNQSPIDRESYPRTADTSDTPLHNVTHSHMVSISLTTFLHTAYTWWCIIRAKHFVLISMYPYRSQLDKIIKNCLNMHTSANKYLQYLQTQVKRTKMSRNKPTTSNQRPCHLSHWQPRIIRWHTDQLNTPQKTPKTVRSEVVVYDGSSRTSKNVICDWSTK